jgi:molybdopterin/thiamine biosynthesis adenylyltransferase
MLRNFLIEHADGDLLPWPRQTEAMARFDLTCAAVEEAALEAGYLPARYQRNRRMISTPQQLKLFRSRAAVVGCGGLGGYILEELARVGVGQIVAIDPDVFEEHNLNRQLLSSVENLGMAKVEAAEARIRQINPAVRLTPIREAFGRQNGPKLFDGADVVIDAVDSIPVRLELAETCSHLMIPMVHGAIAGWYGHVTTVYPGDDSVEKIYRHFKGGKGVEQHLGNPSFTPAVVASLEAAEACKVLLGQGKLLRNRKLSVNLLDMEVEEIPL